MGSNQGVGKAAAWIAAARGGAQLCQFATFLFAARVLGPADFGVFAIASTFHMLVFWIVTSGWYEFILSWEGDQDARDHCFTMATLAGVTLGSVSLALALALRSFGVLESYGNLPVYLACSVFGAGAASTWRGHLHKQGRVNVGSSVEVFAEVCGSLVSIAGLHLGLGIEALGLGKCAFALAGLSMNGLMARWVPRMCMRSAGQTEIASYVKNIAGTRIIHFMVTQSSTLVLTIFLGAGEVGIYRAAKRMVGALAEVVNETVRVLAWSTLSGKNGTTTEEDRTKRLAERSELLMATVVSFGAPVFLGVAAVAEPLVSVLLGPEWLRAAPLAAVMALASLLAIPTIFATPVLTLAQNVGMLPRLRLVTGAIAIGAVVALGPLGANGIVFAELLVAIVSSALTLLAYWRYVQMQPMNTLKSCVPSLGACVVMVCFVLLVRHMGLPDAVPPWLWLGGEILSGAVCFLLIFMSAGGRRAYAQLSVLK